ncbi:unnamed protein product [Rotaria sp. Silwood1]|nr:unnamed protein product [Rotaria sp. Silwood1]
MSDDDNSIEDKVNNMLSLADGDDDQIAALQELERIRQELEKEYLRSQEAKEETNNNNSVQQSEENNSSETSQ